MSVIVILSLSAVRVKHPLSANYNYNRFKVVVLADEIIFIGHETKCVFNDFQMFGLK